MFTYDFLHILKHSFHDFKEELFLGVLRYSYEHGAEVVNSIEFTFKKCARSSESEKNTRS